MDAVLYMLWQAIFPAILTVVTALAGYAAKMFIDYMDVKIGKEHEEWLMKAGCKAWDIVEEYFRLNPEAKTGVDSKIAMFEAEIKKFVPFITDEQVESIRQACAGGFNVYKTSMIN